MRTKLVSTISLAVALATVTGAAAFPRSPQSPVFPPASPGAREPARCSTRAGKASTE